MRRAAWEPEDAAATVATRSTRWSGLNISHATASSGGRPGAAATAEDASSAPTRAALKGDPRVAPRGRWLAEAAREGAAATEVG
jgi:hypothetical protein